jgi:exoribonuclease-2
LDYRGTPAFTIDDDDTLEVDDAITVRSEGNKLVVGIHIADVSCFVAKGDTLDLEAAARSSTIYLPANTVRMFPDRLSTDLASLRRGEDRPAFTVEVEFDEQFNRVGHRLVLSTIHIDRRLSYDEADRLICDPQDNPILRTLHGIALRLQQERTANGAITLRRAEIQVHVDDSGIHVGKLDPNSPSRLLVTELMVLCNRLAADFASLHNLPVVYRTQEPRDASITLPTGNLDPLSFEKLRKSFKRSRLSLTPGPHSGLGVSAYTQASSPIRRFADLVTQRQFAAFLKTEALPYSRDELTGILTGAETSEQEIRGIEDRSTNYWLLEYLSREKMGQPMNGFVLDRKGTIELEDFYLRGKLQTPGGEEPGSVLSVTIDTIQPAKGDVRFKRT